MVQKNVKMLLFGIILAVLAGTMLIVTVSRSRGPDLPPGKTLRDPATVPNIESPIHNIPGPVQQEGGRP